MAAGAPGLTLRWTPGLGHIVHIKGKTGSMANLESARSVSSSRSTRSYHVPEWTHLGNHMDDARLRIRSEEQRVFGQLRAEVVRNLVNLRRNAAVLDELDVACSFATLAEERGLIRPKLNHGYVYPGNLDRLGCADGDRTAHKIVGGRHPVVESGLLEQGRNFTPNNCNVGDDERILLITGQVSPHTTSYMLFPLTFGQAQYGGQKHISETERIDFHSSSDRVLCACSIRGDRPCRQGLQ